MFDRQKLSSRYLIVCLLILAVAILIARFTNVFKAGDAINSFVSKPAVYLFENLSILRRTAQIISNFKKLSDENIRLRQENESLYLNKAEFNAVSEENIFLRKALNLSGLAARKTKIYANVYGLGRQYAGYFLMLNRGSRDGVLSRQAVITEQGVLVGITQEIFESSSRVMLVNDPTFSVTARVFGRQTVGIAKGDGSSGLLLDLIVQDDLIEPQDRIVTSGDDVLPPGLILGLVKEVINLPDQVFKKVIIRPSAYDFLMGPVMVISRD